MYNVCRSTSFIWWSVLIPHVQKMSLRCHSIILIQPLFWNLASGNKVMFQQSLDIPEWAGTVECACSHHTHTHTTWVGCLLKSTGCPSHLSRQSVDCKYTPHFISQQTSIPEMELRFDVSLQSKRLTTQPILGFHAALNSSRAKEGRRLLSLILPNLWFSFPLLPSRPRVIIFTRKKIALNSMHFISKHIFGGIWVKRCQWRQASFQKQFHLFCFQVIDSQVSKTILTLWFSLGTCNVFKCVQISKHTNECWAWLLQQIGSKCWKL